MNNLRWVGAVPALLLAFALNARPAEAATVEFLVGFPTGVVITLSDSEAKVLAAGRKLDIPRLPSKFEAPLRKLAGKIGAANKGRGVKVILIVKVFPKPGISGKVVSR